MVSKGWVEVVVVGKGEGRREEGREEYCITS